MSAAFVLSTEGPPEGLLFPPAFPLLTGLLSFMDVTPCLEDFLFICRSSSECCGTNLFVLLGDVIRYHVKDQSKEKQYDADSE